MQIRKTFFPPRPRKNKKKKGQSLPSSSSSQVTTDSLRSCLSNLSQDTGISTASSSQELQVNLNMDQVKIPERLVTESLSETNGSQLSTQSNSTEDLMDEVWKDWALAMKEMCIMCNERPKNGIFLHSTGGHMCCCYKCAVKYWNKSKRCAYCNLKVRNVLQAFIV